MLCPGAPLWYAHVAFELYHLGYGDWGNEGTKGFAGAGAGVAGAGFHVV